MHTRTRRPRRTQDEVRRRLLDAARDRFAAHGFAGVSTRTIAADAEAAESQIFTYFGSKAGLFEAAVLEPFHEFHQEFNQHWRSEGEVTDLLEETRAYVRGMYELLREHRTLVLAFIAADTFEHEALEGRTSMTFSRLLPPAERNGDVGPWEGYVTAGRLMLWEGYDVATAVRFTFGAILSMSVLDHLFYDGNRSRPSDEHVIDEISRLLVDGYRGPRS